MDKKNYYKPNIDHKTVQGFGNEWVQFDQYALSEEERHALFQSYFSIFPWHLLRENAVGFDLGCGSGRWAKLVAPRVGLLHCIDPSMALEVAKTNMAQFENCAFHRASVDAMPIEDESMDFGYSLGVLHHVPDTAAGLRSCAEKLKRHAPFLLYLYFAFDNKPTWYRWLWKVSEGGRFLLCRTPFELRVAITNLIAVLVYWPLARLALLIEWLGCNPDSFPLGYYRLRSLYVMRTDALDRFGTRLERRFSRKQITEMLFEAGFERISFSENRPYWCAVCFKR